MILSVGVGFDVKGAIPIREKKRESEVIVPGTKVVDLSLDCGLLMFSCLPQDNKTAEIFEIPDSREG